MEQWTSADEILDFAIEKEQEAAHFYVDLAGKVDTKLMKALFEEFAGHERNHKAKLEHVKRAGAIEALGPAELVDLKIADYLVDVSPAKTSLTYQEALILVS